MLLKSKEKKYLRGLAHNLDPAVFLGTSGVNDAFIKAIVENLKANELIKIKFIKFKEDKKDLIKVIAKKTKSQIVGLIGNVLILYKENPKIKKFDFTSI